MLRPLAVTLVAALALTACNDDEPPRDDGVIVLSPPGPGSPGHTHGPGGIQVMGDGTRFTADGYSLVDVKLPQRTGEPEEMSFRIVDRQGRPLHKFIEEQTKQLHLYVVRNDLQDFRHLHPVLGKDGTWRARVALAGPGSYRVLTEFTPGSKLDDPHVVLGRNEIVPGSWSAVPPQGGAVADDGVVRVSVDDPLEVGPDGRMHITIDDGTGRPVSLGSYLSSYAHVTGFQLRTGAFVHVHPYGDPETTDDGTRLTFHTQYDKPGRYRFFVQVRVDGFLHTVPVTATVQ